VRAGIEIGTIVGLHDMDPKRETAQDVVHEPNSRALIARVKDLQHPNAGAIIDGGELIEPPLTTWDPFEKLHVHLEAVSRLRLLVPLPPLAMGSMFLIGRQPVQLVPMQNPMDGGPRNGELGKRFR
jgi:hypothetical protein